MDTCASPGGAAALSGPPAPQHCERRFEDKVRGGGHGVIQSCRSMPRVSSLATSLAAVGAARARPRSDARTPSGQRREVGRWPQRLRADWRSRAVLIETAGQKRPVGPHDRAIDPGSEGAPRGPQFYAWRFFRFCYESGSGASHRATPVVSGLRRLSRKRSLRTGSRSHTRERWHDRR